MIEIEGLLELKEEETTTLVQEEKLESEEKVLDLTKVITEELLSKIYHPSSRVNLEVSQYLETII